MTSVEEVDELEDVEEEPGDEDDADATPVAATAPPRPAQAAPGPRAVGSRPGVAPVAATGPRRVGRIDPSAGRRGRSLRPGSAAAAFEPLDPEEAAIPFDRVPYVPADLRRVALMAGLMVVLIIIAAIVVTATVK
jgi:hypothetical protein